MRIFFLVWRLRGFRRGRGGFLCTGSWGFVDAVGDERIKGMVPHELLVRGDW